MNWQFASALHMGDRNEQQDRVAILHSDGVHLLVLADGMGGHEDGASAAQTVIDIAAGQFARERFDDPRAFLETTCLKAHKAISRLAEDCASAPGSTCVILYLLGSEAYWVHVGDSRLYQFNDNRLIYQTPDHSIARLKKKHSHHVEDKIGDAAPQNQLYMCLGGQNKVTPKFSASQASAGDLFLLCSDGFWSQADVAKLFATIEQKDFDQRKAEQLVELARQQGQNQSDNISLAWAFWQDTSCGKWLGFMKRIRGWF